MTHPLQTATYAAAAVVDASVDVALIDDDVQMVVSVQISKRLHAQLFADVAGAKKRERAERLRWLCLLGLMAERQALQQEERDGEVTSSEGHELTPIKQRSTSRLLPRPFAHRVSDLSDRGTDHARSVVSHPDINELLF